MVDKTNVDLLLYSTFFDGNRFNRNKVKESWVKSHYSIEYSNIEIFCRNNKIETNIFSQKLYHYIFSLTHIPICIKCNYKSQRYEGFNKGYNLFCSKGCASSNSFKKGYETRTQNTIKKYGVSHTTQLESVKEKMKISNMINLGVEYAAQHPDILNKMKKTNIEKYGVEFPMQSESIYKKTLERMSVSNISNLPEVKSKIKENSLKKWGCEWPIQSLEVKEKIKRSFNTSISLKLEDLYKNSNEIKFISYENSISKFNCLKCNQEFTISSSLLYQRYTKHSITVCTYCNKINNRTSSGHTEVCDFLSELGINYTINVRNIISPYEIDIYLPDYKIGIEFNGVYWHSDLIKDKKYHFDKRKMCLEKGVDLIQIWEDDWKFKMDIIKSIIRSRLGKNLIVKWSRKLEIQRIYDEKLVKEFLFFNHLQGWALSGIKYGLFENGNLLSIMTFSKSRINVNNKEWELVRFCNKLNHTVLGSFNKMIKHFIKDNNPKCIISYSDNDIFNGKSYERFKMIKSKESMNYWWCDGQVRHNRWKFRKDVLIKEGSDKSLSGTEIMISKGYFRCWGSGTSRWEISF